MRTRRSAAASAAAHPRELSIRNTFNVRDSEIRWNKLNNLYLGNKGKADCEFPVRPPRERCYNERGKKRTRNDSSANNHWMFTLLSKRICDFLSPSPSFFGIFLFVFWRSVARNSEVNGHRKEKKNKERERDGRYVSS